MAGLRDTQDSRVHPLGGSETVSSPHAGDIRSSSRQQSAEQSRQSHIQLDSDYEPDPCERIVSGLLQKLPVYPPIEGISARKLLYTAVHAAHEATANEEQRELVARLFAHLFSEMSLSNFEDRFRRYQTVDSLRCRLGPEMDGIDGASIQSYEYLDFIICLSEIATLRAARSVEDLRALNGSKILSLALAFTKKDADCAVGRHDISNGLTHTYAGLHGEDDSDGMMYDRFISSVTEDVKLGDAVQVLSHEWGLSMLMFLPSYALDWAKLIPTSILEQAIHAVMALHTDMPTIFDSLLHHYLAPITAGEPLTGLRFVFEPETLRKRWKNDEGVSFARLIQVTASAVDRE